MQLDVYERPLTLGIQPAPNTRQLFDSAPPRKYAVQVDAPERPVTLVAPAALPAVLRWDASAPPLKVAVEVDPAPWPLTLGINPNPAPRQQSDSAPPPKIAVYVDQQVHPLALGINPNPAVRQQSDSAPSAKPVVSLDSVNRLVLPAVVVSPVLPVDTSQWQPKFQVQVDQIPHPLTLGINPNPAVRQQFDSAPPKFAVQVDQPLVHPLTLGINPNPAPGRLDASAPPPKFAVQVDYLVRPIALGIQPAPATRQLDSSAPQAKAGPQVNVFANTAVLAPVAPPGLQLDATPKPKFAVQVDQAPRPLPLGINPNPAVRQLDVSAPPLKIQIQLDQPLGSPRTLGINPNPAARQQFESAPPKWLAKFAVQVDQYPNLLTLGLAVSAVPLVGAQEVPAGRLIRTIYQVQWQSRTYQFHTLFDALAFVEKVKKEERRKLLAQLAKDKRNKPTLAPSRQVTPKAPIPEAPIVKAISQNVEVVYEQDLVDAGIRLMMELNKRQRDDDENLFWLM